MAEKKPDLAATPDSESAYKTADYVVIAAPRIAIQIHRCLDTSVVETVIDPVIKANPNAVMVIKSTVPVGYTESIRKKIGSKNIIFSSEFLRESKVFYDNSYLSHIIMGTDMNGERLINAVQKFAELLQREQSRKIQTHSLWASQRLRR